MFLKAKLHEESKTGFKIIKKHLNEPKLLIFGAETSFLEKIVLGRDDNQGVYRDSLTTIDYFEPSFRFIMQFWFEKHMSAPWNPKGMISGLSGHSGL